MHISNSNVRETLPLGRALLRDDRGSVLVGTLFFMIVFFALGGIMIASGRLYTTHTELQNFADNIALAAAAELDGEFGAINRAVLAGTGPASPGPLVADGHTFGEGTGALSVSELTFLESLGDGHGPAGDVAGDVVRCTYTVVSGSTSCDGMSQAQADAVVRFVEATVEPVTLNYTLIRILNTFGFGVNEDTDVTTYAIAGFTREVCNSPPLMICNPYEDPTTGGGAYTPIIGRQIVLKSQGPGTQWAPGTFGLLDQAETGGEGDCSGGGANRIRCVLGLVEPNTSCVEGTVDTQPGEAVSVHDGLNYRFDIWSGGGSNSRKNNPKFAPSANVTKGAVIKPSCSDVDPPPSAPADTVALPRDPCFTDPISPCTTFGDATTTHWQTGGLNAYWSVNHAPMGAPPVPFATRYDAYRYEIDNGLIPNKSALGGENGNPTCASSSVDNPERDRRQLIVAVVNCVEHNVQGSTPDVPVIAFARMFLTEHIERTGPSLDKNAIWAEELGVVQPGDLTGVLHDFPVLFR